MARHPHIHHLVLIRWVPALLCLNVECRSWNICKWLVKIVYMFWVWLGFIGVWALFIPENPGEPINERCCPMFDSEFCCKFRPDCGRIFDLVIDRFWLLFIGISDLLLGLKSIKSPVTFSLRSFSFSSSSYAVLKIWSLFDFELISFSKSETSELLKETSSPWPCSGLACLLW